MFTLMENLLGLQPIALSSAVQNHPEGTVVRALDPTLGGGEFIYLKGVVGTTTGMAVTYDPVNHTTTLVPTAADNKLAQPIAVAMSANVASQWGWYQIGGCAVIKKTATKVLANVALYLSGTAGRLQSLSAHSGAQVLNCRTVNAASVLSAVSTITAVIDRPFLQGQTI